MSKEEVLLEQISHSLMHIISEIYLFEDFTEDEMDNVETIKLALEMKNKIKHSTDYMIELIDRYSINNEKENESMDKYIQNCQICGRPHNEISGCKLLANNHPGVPV